MSNKVYANIDRLLALAAIFQAASLVKDLAYRGVSNEKYLLPSINSLFKLSSTSTLDIYENDISNLKFGLEEIVNLFSSYFIINFSSSKLFSKAKAAKAACFVLHTPHFSEKTKVKSSFDEFRR